MYLSKWQSVFVQMYLTPIDDVSLVGVAAIPGSLVSGTPKLQRRCWSTWSSSRFRQRWWWPCMGILWLEMVNKRLFVKDGCRQWANIFGVSEPSVFVVPVQPVSVFVCPGHLYLCAQDICICCLEEEGWTWLTLIQRPATLSGFHTFTHHLCASCLTCNFTHSIIGLYS